MISVIIPSYNREHSIIDAVQSVLRQTYQDIEVIVVDDGSTDNTCKLLEKLNDQRIRVIHQNHEGACAARNRGVDEARGEYIAFHDSDDICKADRLEHELQILIEKDADFVCGNVLTHLDGKTFIAPNYKAAWLTAKDMLFNITTMTFFGKAEVFKKYRFDPQMPRWQDLDFLLQIYDKVRVYFTEHVLCDYYREGDSMSLNPQKCIDAYNIIIEKYPYIVKDGGLLYSRLRKMYADSKVAMGKGEYIDYKETYKNNKSIVNFIWLCFSKLKMEHILYRYLHRK